MMKQSNTHLIIFNHGKRTAEQYIINRKGGHNLTFDGYIYRVNRRIEDKVFWRSQERAKRRTDDSLSPSKKR